MKGIKKLIHSIEGNEMTDGKKNLYTLHYRGPSVLLQGGLVFGCLLWLFH